MRSTTFRAAALATVLLLLGLGACGGDDSAAESTSTTKPRTTTTKADLADYCAKAQGYIDAVSIETDTLEDTIAGLQSAAAAARALADVAPSAVKDEHEAIATSAEQLVAGIIAADPQDTDELGEVGTTVTEALVEQYGSLDEEVATFSEFARAECGLALGSSLDGPQEATE